VVAVALLPSSITIVDAGESDETRRAEAFDPAAYVDGIWESELIPTVESEAADLSAILSAMEVQAGVADKDQLLEVVERYGSVTDGEAHVYLVRGSGTVTEVSPLGMASIQLDGYDGPISVELYLGNRIPSDETSARDAVGFIKFGDFREQTEYGMVGTEINRRIAADVIAPLLDTDPAGQQISFDGAMGIRTFNLVQIDLDAVQIVPVVATLGGPSDG
jgi:predicted lipoprotein